MSLRVAITRAQPEAEKTAARVRAYGAEAIAAPLLTIAPRAFDTDLTGAQALLFTSANGVRAFAAQAGATNLPALTVGDATADAARAAGFADVRSADGDSEKLAAFAAATLDPRAGRVLHISGAHVAGDIVAALTASGFAAERRVAYEAVAALELPEALRGPVDIVLFHSVRAAEIHASLGAPEAERRIAACLSQKVAEAAMISPAGRIAWKRVIVAPRPREDALLAALFTSTGASA